MDNKLEMMEESFEERGVLYCEFNNRGWTCEEIQREIEKAESCALCDLFGSDGGWKLYETEEARKGFAEWFCNDKYGKQTYVKTLSPEDYWELKTFCNNWGEGVCYVCDDVAYIGGK